MAGLLAIALLVTVGTACNGKGGPETYFTEIAVPPGDAPLRYRDAVFATQTVTSNVVWSTAPDLKGNPVTLKLDVSRSRRNTQRFRRAAPRGRTGLGRCGDQSSMSSWRL